MRIDKELVRELRDSGLSWEEVEYKYNHETGDNKKSNSLRANYSRYKTVDKDKTIVSNTTIETHDGELLTPEELILRRGLDPKRIRMKSGKSHYGQIGTTKNEEGYLVNSNLSFEFEEIPYRLNEEKINELLDKRNIKAKKLKRTVTNGVGLFEIPIFDPHFGVNTFEDYENVQQQIANYILSKEWETILFVIGQDLFHNDDFRGRTTSGTLIEVVDMERAWEDVHRFYIPLFELALENAKNVNIIYSRGNHDETLGWAFVKSIERLYPQIEVDSRQAEHKIFTYHNVLLGYTHGDKVNDKKIVRNFEALFRIEMAKANRRIIKRGHLHTHKQFDDNGTHVIALGTGAKTDQWHLDNGYVGNHKAFEVFMYDENTLRAHMFIE